MSNSFNYNRESLLGQAKDKFPKQYMQTLNQLNGDSEAADSTFYKQYREFLINYTNEDGTKLIDTNPEQNIPEWADFTLDENGGHFINSNILNQKRQAKASLEGNIPSENNVSDIMSNKPKFYQPGEFVSRGFQSITGLSEKTYNTYQNNSIAASMYYRKHGVLPYDTDNTYDPGIFENIGGLVLIATNPLDAMFSFGGSSFMRNTVGKLTGEGLQQALGASFTKKTFNSIGWTKNRLKSFIYRGTDKVGAHYAKRTGKQYGTDLLSNSASKFLNHANESFWGWHGFTFAHNYFGELTKQAQTQFERGLSPQDATYDYASALWNANLHSMVEGGKGIVIGQIGSKLQKVHFDATKVSGGFKKSLFSVLKQDKKVKESLKTLSTSAFPRFAAEVTAMDALTAFQQYYDGSLPNAEEIEKQGGLTTYLLKRWTGTAAVVGTYKGFHNTWPAMKNVMSWSRNFRKKSLKTEIAVIEESLAEMKSRHEIVTDISGKENVLDIDVDSPAKLVTGDLENIKTKLIKSNELTAFLDACEIAQGKNINDIKLIGSVDEIIENGGSEEINKILELISIERHRIETITEDPAIFERMVIDTYRKEKGLSKDVEISKGDLDNAKNVILSVIERANKFSDDVNDKIANKDYVEEDKPLDDYGKEDIIEQLENSIENYRDSKDVPITKKQDKSLKKWEQDYKDGKLTFEQYEDKLQKFLEGKGATLDRAKGKRDIIIEPDEPLFPYYGTSNRSKATVSKIKKAITDNRYYQKQVKKGEAPKQITDPSTVVKKLIEDGHIKEANKYSTLLQLRMNLPENHRLHIPPLEGQYKTFNENLLFRLLDTRQNPALIKGVTIINDLLKQNNNKKLSHITEKDIKRYFKTNYAEGSDAGKAISPFKKAWTSLISLENSKIKDITKLEEFKGLEGRDVNLVLQGEAIIRAGEVNEAIVTVKNTNIKDKPIDKATEELIKLDNFKFKKEDGNSKNNEANLRARLVLAEESYGLRQREQNKLTRAHIKEKDGIYFIDLGFQNTPEGKALAISKVKPRPIPISKQLYTDLISFHESTGLNIITPFLTHRSGKLIHGQWEASLKGQSIVKNVSLDLIRNRIVSNIHGPYQRILALHGAVASTESKRIIEAASLIYKFHEHLADHSEKGTGVITGNYFGLPITAWVAKKDARYYAISEIVKEIGSNKISFIDGIDKVWKIIDNKPLSDYERNFLNNKPQETEQGTSEVFKGGAQAVSNTFGGQKLKIIAGPGEDIKQSITNRGSEWALASAEILAQVGLKAVDKFKSFKQRIIKEEPALKGNENLIKNLYNDALINVNKIPELKIEITAELRRRWFKYIGDKNIKKGSPEAIAELTQVAKLPGSDIINPEEFARNFSFSNDSPIEDVLRIKNLFEKIAVIPKRIGKDYLSKAREVWEKTEDLSIPQDKFNEILDLFSVPNRDLYRATEKQIDAINTFLSRDNIEQYVKNPRYLRDIDKDIFSYVGEEKSKKIRALSIINKPAEVMRKLGFRTIASAIVGFGATKGRYRGRLAVLQEDMINSLSSIKLANNKPGGFDMVPSKNVVDRAKAKRRFEKEKSYFAVITDPYMAEKIMTEKSINNPKKLAIEVIDNGMHSEKYKELIPKAYDKDYNLREDTVEGLTVKAIRDHYEFFKESFIEHARNNLTAREWQAFETLFGPEGVKWISQYGFRRASEGFIETFKRGNPLYDQMFNKIYVEEIKKEVKKHFTKKNKIDDYNKIKNSQQDLLNIASKITYKGRTIRDIANENAEQRLLDKFTFSQNRISSSNLKSRVGDDVPFTREYHGMEIPTFTVGIDAWDRVIGGHANANGKLFATLEYFTDYVDIPGVKPRKNSRKLLHGLLSALYGKTPLDQKTVKFIVKTIEEDVLGLKGPGELDEKISSALGLIVNPLSILQLGGLGGPLLTNVTAGTTLNVLAYGGIKVGKSIPFICNAAHRRNVNEMGLVLAGTNVYREGRINAGNNRAARYFQNLIELPFKTGGTVAGEKFQRYQTDAVVQMDLAETLKEAVMGAKNTKRGGSFGALERLKHWYKFNDKQIDLAIKFQNHLFETSFHVPEQIKLSKEIDFISDCKTFGYDSPEKRIELINELANILLHGRFEGATMTQGTTERSSLPPYLNKRTISYALLFKKMMLQATAGMLAHLKLAGRTDAWHKFFGRILQYGLSSLALGYLKTKFLEETNQKDVKHEDDITKRLIYYALNAEMGQAFGDLAGGQWAMGVRNSQLFSLAPVGSIWTVVSTFGNVGGKLLLPKENADNWKDILIKPLEGLSGGYRVSSSIFSKTLYKENRDKKKWTKNVYDFKSRSSFKYGDSPEFAEETISDLTENVFSIDKNRQRLKGDAYNSQDYKNKIKEAFWTIEPDLISKVKGKITGKKPENVQFEDFDFAIRSFVSTRTDELQKDGIDVVRAGQIVAEELRKYLTPDVLLGLPGLGYAKSNGKIWTFPNKYKEGYKSPIIAVPIKNLKGLKYDSILYEKLTSVSTPEKQKGKNLTWDYFNELRVTDIDKAREFINYLEESQDRIDKMWKYMTESGLYNIFVEKDGSIKFVDKNYHGYTKGQLESILKENDILFSEWQEKPANEIFKLYNKSKEIYAGYKDNNMTGELTETLKALQKEITLMSKYIENKKFNGKD